MAIGYALLAQELTINGNASIDSTWKVEITNITQKKINGGVTEKSKSYTATTANFDIGFTQPGDYVVYDIEVTNSGTLDAVISNINVVTDNNPAIIYTTSGLKRGNKIAKNGEKKYLTVKIEYDSNITSQPQNNDNDITIQMDYQQDLGQITAYNYVIGDKISFAGSDWYVITNSTVDDDYVTLMKEKILTNAVLGSYASSPDNDAMEFTWNDNCHNNNHGYTDYAYSCDNTNNYNESKVKEFLEGTYINTLGTNNLKEINGYKIRLITLEELQQNFGWTELNVYATSGDNSSVPTWVYRDFTVDKIAYGYWTMTPKPSPSNNVWFMSTSEQLNVYYGHDYGNTGVRPVINLLKSAIE